MALISASRKITSNLEGADHGSAISLILDHSEAGSGPRLHQHPYDETWLVIDGSVTFTAADEQFDAGPDDVVVVPPNTPHRFVSNGPEPARLVCIHPNPRFETQWLE